MKHQTWRIPIFVAATLLFVSSLTFGDSLHWAQKATQVEKSIHTLNVLLDVAAFPNNVPGLNTALSNKVDDLIANLGDLSTTLESEMPLMNDQERNESLDRFADLLVGTADVGERLDNRGLDTLVSSLGTDYTAHYATYGSLTLTYGVSAKLIPQYNDLSKWNLPG